MQQTSIDRYWLLTWTTYGSWLPGDPRGSVTRVRDRRPGEPDPRRAGGVSPLSPNAPNAQPNSQLGGLTPTARQVEFSRPPRHEHDIPGTPYDCDIPGLQLAARTALKCPTIRLTFERSFVLFTQFQETAQYRCWKLFAVGIMANHVHIVVGVPGDPEPETILRDFKSYGSRALNREWTRPVSGTWWTDSGSKRKLPNEDAILAAIRYVVEQEYPLLIWTTDVPELGLVEGFHHPPHLAADKASGGRQPSEASQENPG